MAIENPGYEDICEGDYVKPQGEDKFFKVDKKHGNGELEMHQEYPETDEDVKKRVKVGFCVVCLTQREFSQAKRFMPGGTGFKKQGRKIQKKDYSKYLDFESHFDLSAIETMAMFDNEVTDGLMEIWLDNGEEE